MSYLENKEICSKCGGRCCLKSGCDYFTSDLESVTLQCLTELLDTENVSIVAALKMDRLKNGKTVATPFLYLRARNTDRDIVDLFSMKTKCSMLTENGCSYSIEDRPSGGVNLIPKEDMMCIPAVNPVEEIKKWEPYQKLLSRLVRRYSGLSVDEKLKLDVENTFYKIITNDFEDIRPEEIADILSCFHDLINAFPEEYEKAMNRKNNLNVLIRKKTTNN